MNRSAAAIELDPQSSIVELTQLSRCFGDERALDNINLDIPKGGVFGLVGVNGAGKTTLIKHILGLYKAKAGTVSVFGLNPITQPEQVLSRIGYMSEVTELPEWMRIVELMRYTQAFYPDWDDACAKNLLDKFELDAHKKIRELSKGQRARVALLLAISHQPDLLILDEPSSGLDPLVRRDILRTVIQAVANDGRTVLFSSHLLEEVERIADSVAIIDEGKIVAQGALDDLKLQHQRLLISFNQELEKPPTIQGALAWQGSGRNWTTVFQGDLADATDKLNSINATLVKHNTPNLDQLFLALVGDKHPSLESGS